MMLFTPKSSLRSLSRQLQAGTVTSRELTEIALSRIEAGQGNGGGTYILVDAVGARAQADAMDACRRAGTSLSPLMGLPVSIKDLFDIQGQQTRAGSIALKGAPIASHDAPAVARLRKAGAVLIGRTNMSEFAYSGLGINPHYGTPATPWRADEKRVPGGSSSGAAVSVAQGMAAIALGTDTGGSVRIPAAYCGIAAFKPTARRVPRDGGVPLSVTLDSFGPLGATVDCCVAFDRVLSGSATQVRHDRPVRGLRLGVLQTYVMEHLDPVVASAYAKALSVLSAAGAELVDIAFPALSSLPDINRWGFSAIESYAWHRSLMSEQNSVYDPRVLAKIRAGAGAQAADYIDLLNARADTIRAAQSAFGGFDAILSPTVPNLPPKIADVETDDNAFSHANALSIRNTAFVNFIDGCALTIPLPAAEDAPVGLMVTGLSLSDEAILSAGYAIEKTVQAE